ncbi:hypothetical protein PMIN02_006404 [Paraphaeosphaeria minitans]
MVAENKAWTGARLVTPLLGLGWAFAACAVCTTLLPALPSNVARLTRRQNILRLPVRLWAHCVTPPSAFFCCVFVASSPRSPPSTTPSLLGRPFALRSGPAAMATPSDTPSAARPLSRPASGHGAPSTDPVEMDTLATSALEPATAAEAANSTAHTTEAAPAPSTDAHTPHTQETLPQESIEPAPAAPASKLAPPVDLSRSETEAIGPSTDTPTANPDSSNGPVVVIMLLLTTGARHPYKIDERYLKKRNVTVDDMDPYNISVYTLKELIWRDWREEWEPRPTSPSSIRLIHFGRMLDDKSPLKECRFQTETPNVVHMTVKPQEIVDEEDAKTGKGGKTRDGDEEIHTGCRCAIL